MRPFFDVLNEFRDTRRAASDATREYKRMQFELAAAITERFPELLTCKVEELDGLIAVLPTIRRSRWNHML